MYQIGDFLKLGDKGYKGDKTEISMINKITDKYIEVVLVKDTKKYLKLYMNEKHELYVKQDSSIIVSKIYPLDEFLIDVSYIIFLYLNSKDLFNLSLTNRKMWNKIHNNKNFWDMWGEIHPTNFKLISTGSNISCYFGDRPSEAEYFLLDIYGKFAEDENDELILLPINKELLNTIVSKTTLTFRPHRDLSDESITIKPKIPGGISLRDFFQSLYEYAEKQIKISNEEDVWAEEINSAFELVGDHIFFEGLNINPTKEDDFKNYIRWGS